MLRVIHGGPGPREYRGRNGQRSWAQFLFGLRMLLLDFFRRVTGWPATYFVVTNERMLLIRGPFSRTVTAMPLDKAMGLKLQRTILGRLLGYGSLIVVSPDRRKAFRKVRYLPHPEQLYLEISGLLSPDKVARPQASGSSLCEMFGCCTALSIFHREEVSRYGTQQEILRHGAPMNKEF